MYKVLLVDDEAPALRLLQAIFDKYAPDYKIEASFQSGEEALEYLSSHTVDLMITDISMPSMDGITLAQEARALQPALRMVIVSGYAQFEYAQGAIKAAVDDYILKPITIPYITATLDKIKRKLDQTRASQEPSILAALLAGDEIDGDALRKFYGDDKYHFAYIRWGNLAHHNEDPLPAVTPANSQGHPFHILQGRNQYEQILYARSDISVSDFHTSSKAYTAQAYDTPTWTLIFSRTPIPFSSFGEFVHEAENLYRDTVVIGRHHYMSLSPLPHERKKAYVSPSILKKLNYFCQSGNNKHIKDLLFTLATEWEKRQIPQLSVYYMVQQLMHTVLACKPNLASNQEALQNERLEIFARSTSYSDLMAGIYTLLFDETLDTDKRLSPEELYESTLAFIREKYGEAIDIPYVCREIGISQTYLSRLFRKYGDTSFNVFLTECRIEGAMQLMLKHPDMRMRDVAACVGYGDPSYFSKVFLQATGKSPSQWAEDNQVESDPS